MKLFNKFQILLFLFAIAWAQAPSNNVATVIPPYSMKVYDQNLQTFYSTHPASQSTNLQTRLDADSGFFLGKPYVLGALGEGPNAKFDQSPLYRTDAFDCVTYVSTVLAMVESTNLQQFRQNMISIQYSNHQPSYLSRNHFVSVDWNPKNQEQGYLTDITTSLFPNQTLASDTLIDRPNWFLNLPANNLKLLNPLSLQQTNALLVELQSLAKHTTPVFSRLPYVPLTALFDKNGKAIASQFDKIPSGVVIEIIRPNWNLKQQIGTNLNVSHLGIGIRVNNVLMYREASSLDNKVEDQPLSQYLSEYLNSPTVKGINIQRINLKT